MKRRATKTVWRILGLGILLGGLDVTGYPQPASVSADSFSQGKAVDPGIGRLDTDFAHYTKSADGVVHLQLFNSPVGIPDRLDRGGWRLRDPALHVAAGSNSVVPTDLPFGLQVASSTASSAEEAAVTNEDGTTLAIGLTSINGEPPTVAAGQVTNGAMTFHSIVSPSGDLTLRPTISGLDAHVTLGHQDVGGGITFTLKPDARASFVQDADGAITMVRAQQYCGSTGCNQSQDPEYVVQPPIARDSNPDPIAQSFPGPATAVFTTAADGAGQLTVRIDPAWLDDPARVFPISLDLPISTAFASTQSGVFGTVNSCAPTISAAPTRVAVGAAGSCTYHGIAYFDLSSLLPQFTIQAAVLKLYTPSQTGPSGVQVLANRPVAMPQPPSIPSTRQGPPPRTYPGGNAPVGTPPSLPAIQTGHVPSWSDVPVPDTNMAGMVQSGSEGHWQSWDLSTVARQWQQNRYTNAGVTLVNAGAPVLFASSLGTQDDNVQSAPYLDITLASSSPAAQPAQSAAQQVATSSSIRQAIPSAAGPCTSCTYNDGGATIYGAGGTLYPDGFCTSHVACSRGIEYQAAAKYLGASYVRAGGVLVPCIPAGQGSYYPEPTFWSQIYDYIFRASEDNLIPVVTFIQNDQCVDGNGQEHTDWYGALSSFAAFLPSARVEDGGARPLPKHLYVEIGNEMNVGGKYPNYNRIWKTQYPVDFNRASTGLYASMLYYKPSYTTYHIITGGIISPTATTDTVRTNCSQDTLVMANNALYAAHFDPYTPVPGTYLGVGVHPYSYTTNDLNYWRNYRQDQINGRNTVCGDIYGMVQVWHSYFYNTVGTDTPIVLTEDNYSSTIDPRLGPGGETTSHDAKLSGEFLADLMTYLYDTYSVDFTARGLTQYPLRVVWYDAVDEKDPYPPSPSYSPPYLGLFDGSGASKILPTLFCFNTVNQNVPLPSIFSVVSTQPCY